MAKFDGETDLEAVERLESCPAIAIADLHRLADAHEAFCRVLLLDPSRLDQEHERPSRAIHDRYFRGRELDIGVVDRSEEHTSELQSLMRISYADFCLKKKNSLKTTT